MGSTKKNNTVKKLSDKLSSLSAENSDYVPDSEFSDDENVEELFEHYKFIVDKGQSMMRLDKYITSRMFETSRNRVQMAIEAGYVRVGGKIAKSNYKIKPLDEISLVFPY
jgi:23S rRNA pseudouridine1911/1915/1917 synthase